MEKIGRLAMRHEGQQWNAYYALADTMNGAIFLGSITMAAIAENPARKQAFMNMMRDVVSDILEERLGVRLEWGGPQAAPEHERSGHS